MMRWTSYGTVLPQRWTFKRDIPVQHRHNGVKIIFPFEVAWIVRDHEGDVLMPGGAFAAALDFHLHTPGHVIGLRDMISADGQKWAHEWRAAASDRMLERCELSAACGGNH